MKKLILITGGLLVGLQMVTAEIEYDQNVTPDVIFGDGNANGSFTVERANGVELGLRAKLRFDENGDPQNIFNSNGDGTYSFDPVNKGSELTPKAEWCFEWSVNTHYETNDGWKLADLTYMLRIDSDPSNEVSYIEFDPISVQEADHALGYNNTSNGGGVVDKLAYTLNKGIYNVAQNSWQPHWFINDLNPVVDGIYDIVLAAYSGSELVAKTSIQVIVGNPMPSPDPNAGFITGGGSVGNIGGTNLVWSQNFDQDREGWFDYNGTVTLANGVGIIEGGAFSRFEGYNDSWTGTWIAEIDVFLNTDWAIGTGFDYTVAANGSDGAHQRDYIFHVTKDSSTGQLLVGGSNNTNFVPREDLENINHAVVEVSGWYTLQHVFYEENGALKVDLNLLDATGNLLFTETRDPGADDLIPDAVGGNRYAWFCANNVPGLWVDNHKRYAYSEGPLEFGFVSKYVKNSVTPKGNVDVNYDLGGFKFHSNSHDWLVIMDGTTGIISGSGLVNDLVAPNGDEFQFMLWGIDGGKEGEDSFGIKIWWMNEGVEDIVLNIEETQVISSGNIKIHKN